MASQDWFEKDFYKVLGVEKDISAADLKKRYRKLARENHPDSHPGDAAAESRFKEISEAYSVLSDEAKRKEYDQVRAMGAGARFAPGAGGFEDMFGGFFGGGARGAGAGRGGRAQYSNADFEDLLGQMFGGAGGPGAGAGFGAGPGGFQTGFQPGAPMKGRNQTASTSVSFRAAALGDTLTLQTSGGRTVNVRIPAGVRDGQKIRLAGKGGEAPPGGQPGDLTLTVTVRPDPVFTRGEGNNLGIEVPITFVEAVRGATIEVPTLDGGTVKLKVPEFCENGKVLRVKGRGIAAKSGTGDLHVTLRVAVPGRLTDAQSKALDEFAAASSAESPRDDLLRKAQGAS